MLNKQVMVTPDNALKGRPYSMELDFTHVENLAPINTEPSNGQEKILFAMGCFWGAEKLFWPLEGVITTGVGYSGGITPNPTYEEICTGKTGHAEVVRVVYDPQILPLETLLRCFWENHNPTQEMRQGTDVGTQYRSAIYYYSPQQKSMIERSLATYQTQLSNQHFGVISTEIHPAGPFYFAEQDHQQYLTKHPDGYCPHHGTGVLFMPT